MGAWVRVVANNSILPKFKTEKANQRTWTTMVSTISGGAAAIAFARHSLHWAPSSVQVKVSLIFLPQKNFWAMLFSLRNILTIWSVNGL